MRTAGFPCRSQGCDHVFQVADQNSMPELHAASAARTAHELSAHEYHHVTVVEPTINPYQRSAAKTRIPKQV